MSKGVKRDGGMLLDSGVYTQHAIYGGTARGMEKPCNKIDGISLDVQSHDDEEEKGEGKGELHLATKHPPLLLPRHKGLTWQARRTDSISGSL